MRLLTNKIVKSIFFLSSMGSVSTISQKSSHFLLAFPSVVFYFLCVKFLICFPLLEA
jgi:hypothetical protein